MRYQYVIIRHLKVVDARPVAHKVITKDYEMSERELELCLEETKTEFCAKYIEFNKADWYIDLCK